MKISIIIPCFNRELYLARAIRSALAQNFQRSEFEVIVVDDGSNDHSSEVAADFGDQIVYVRHSENMGLPVARNTGIRRARGRFLVNLDSDDYLHEDLLYVEHLHLCLNPHWGAVSCDYVYVNDFEQHVSRVSSQTKPIACGVMFRKDAMIAIGLYDESLRMCEDEELRLRFLECYHIGHVDLPLYRYRLHSGNMSNDAVAIQRFRSVVREKRGFAVADTIEDVVD